jgi:WD40 repeat protein
LMSKRNETGVLLITLLITVALVVGGLGWFLSSPFNPWTENSRLRGPSAVVPDGSVRTNPVISLAVTADGRTLATGNYGSTITLWDLRTQSPSVLDEHRGRVNSLVMSGDRLISGSGDGSVRVWDIANGYEVQEPLVAGGRVLSLAAAGNSTVAAGYSDGSVRIWDMQQGTAVRLIRAHTDQVTTLVFAPNTPGQLVSGSHDGTVKVWDLSTAGNEPQQQITLNSKVNSVDISPDGTLIASGDYDGNIRLWELATGEETGRSLPGHTFIIGEVEFGPNGNLLVSAGYDEKIKVWDLRTGKEYRTFDLSPEQAGFVFAAEFIATPATVKLATAGYDGRVRIWDLETGEAESILACRAACSQRSNSA